jgi:hypothetical protein
MGASKISKAKSIWLNKLMIILWEAPEMSRVIRNQILLEIERFIAGKM